MLGFAFLVAVIGVVLAVVFWFQGQSAASVVKALRDEAEADRKDIEAARAEQRKLAEELKSRSAQLLETREKLTEARKKAQETKVGKAQTRNAREAGLEEDLAHARKLIEEAHAAESAARRELSVARGAEAQVKSELAAAHDRIRELTTSPAAPAPAAAAPAQLVADYQTARTQLEAARNELERQVQQAERSAREAKRREQELRDEIRKHKGRAETNNRVYLVTKGELEVTRERLAQAERKLWQAGIPLAPPQSKDRPRATGPAAADRSREEPAAPSAPAEEPVAEESPRSGEPNSRGAENGVQTKPGQG